MVPLNTRVLPAILLVLHLRGYVGGRLNTLVLLAIQPHDDSLLLSTIIIIVATATPYSKLTQLASIMGSKKDERTGARKRKWRKVCEGASNDSGSCSSSIIRLE